MNEHTCNRVHPGARYLGCAGCDADMVADRAARTAIAIAAAHRELRTQFAIAIAGPVAAEARAANRLGPECDVALPEDIAIIVFNLADALALEDAARRAADETGGAK